MMIQTWLTLVFHIPFLEQSTDLLAVLQTIILKNGDA